jgi:DNA-binding CsgD family transcriptional regulator
MTARTALGLTNKESARSLSLNQRAVEFHLDKLMEKIGVRSRRGR